jgi:hypothetical protein
MKSIEAERRRSAFDGGRSMRLQHLQARLHGASRVDGLLQPIDDGCGRDAAGSGSCLLFDRRIDSYCCNLFY